MSTSESYDIIVCGAGLSGLLLLYFLQKKKLLDNKSILVIDQLGETLGHKTFSYWQPKDKPYEFDSLVAKRWQQLRVKFGDSDRTISLTKYEYCSIHGQDLERYIRTYLQKNKHITWLTASVAECKEIHDGVDVDTSLGKYYGKLAYTSILDKSALAKNDSANQYFTGVGVVVTKPCFDSTLPTLLDFPKDTQQEHEFFYLLPYDETHALIECVSNKEPKDEILQAYANKVLTGKQFTINYRESGCTPLTSLTLIQHLTKIIPIGIPAGTVSPLTGYSFVRALQMSQRIVQSLKDDVPIAKRRSLADFFYSLVDTAYLSLYTKDVKAIQKVYERLYTAVTPDTLFQFLDRNPSLRVIVKVGIGIAPFLGVFTRLLGSSIVARGRKNTL